MRPTKTITKADLRDVRAHSLDGKGEGRPIFNADSIEDASRMFRIVVNGGDDEFLVMAQSKRHAEEIVKRTPPWEDSVIESTERWSCRLFAWFLPDGGISDQFADDWLRTTDERAS